MLHFVAKIIKPGLIPTGVILPSAYLVNELEEEGDSVLGSRAIVAAPKEEAAFLDLARAVDRGSSDEVWVSATNLHVVSIPDKVQVVLSQQGAVESGKNFLPRCLCELIPGCVAAETAAQEELETRPIFPSFQERFPTYRVLAGFQIASPRRRNTDSRANASVRGLQCNSRTRLPQRLHCRCRMRFLLLHDSRRVRRG
jgi:hypothetical protein